MLTNYIKIAFRILWRHKTYSFINIMGLALGMACCTVIFLWVQHELSYDRFHENADDIYRVVQNIKFTNRTTSWAITQGPLGPSLLEDYPDIVNMMRVTRERFCTVRYKDKVFDETVYLADGSFFDMFSFPLLKGDPSSALTNILSIVLDEDMAQKYFGSEDPLGKTMRLNLWDVYQFDLTVTGLMKNIPTNSSLRPKIIVPFKFGKKIGATVDHWNNSYALTYIQLRKNVDSRRFVEEISRYLYSKPTIEKDSLLNLLPLLKIHLQSNYDFDLARGDITYVVSFAILAIFILVIACINYMNLATARFTRRAREVGLRKALGAAKADIRRQFLGEATIIALLALFLAMILTEIMLPGFNQFVGLNLSFDVNENPQIVMTLIFIVIISGGIAGSYPAIFLSSFQPVQILRGMYFTRHRGWNFRKILIPFQFALTIMIMICTLVSYNQFRYLQNKKMGYDTDAMLCIGLRGEGQKHFPALKAELLKHNSILGVTTTYRTPDEGYEFTNSLWRWEGQDPNEEVLFRGVRVGDDFFETLGLEIVDGRSFSKDFPSDEKNAVIINETAAKAMNFDSPIGKHLIKDGKRYKIIGIVRDYHYRSLHHKIEPYIMLYRRVDNPVLIVKLKPGNIQQTIDYIEKLWKKFEPNYPILSGFLDEFVTDLYQDEKRIRNIFAVASVLTIGIACLGLFGLTMFTAERRTKEIGIRKAFGAGVGATTAMLVKEMVRWILIANIIAWPLAYMAMNRWLQNFAYRIDIDWGVFFLSGLLALIIAMLTVGYQTVKAAMANPAESLRYE